MPASLAVLKPGIATAALLVGLDVAIFLCGFEKCYEAGLGNERRETSIEKVLPR